ncbi:site-specific integrase [Methylotenera oryzisoli]|uniref:Site-specific integrase n=1 Tax=Methylotenera oryzisoli TaxID=2080758 RepID=A0A4Y9VSA8_9PROT|nr:DUF3596 domain-containing protein [Methylotenera oryzisoli]TFW71481.1 site-specific integrase [Methylotenera oryzisoli]
MGQRRETGIEERGNSIRVSFQWRGARCRETINIPPTKSNMQYAAGLRAEILRKIGLGTFDYADYFPESPKAQAGVKKIDTFADASDTWLKANSQLAKSSLTTYQKHLNKHWLPKFGKHKITEITYTELMAHLADLKVTPKTRNNIVIPMRRILDAAFLDGIIASNPAARIRNVKAQRPEPDPFTINEVNLILEHIKTTYNEQVLNYFEFGFFSGLRTSELIDLKWGDVEETLVVVRSAKVEGESKTTKTNQVRFVELNARAKAALARQKAHTKLKSVYVFLNPITETTWNDQRSQSKVYWTPTLKQLKLHHRNPYQMRHTFATLMLMAGANPMWVARQLGHANMKITLEVYSKWIDLADKSRELDKVNNALFAPNLPQEKASTAES